MPSWLSVIKKVRQIIQRLSNIVLYRISPLFSKSGFFLQGQMDIHPLSFWHNASLCSETGGFWPREKKEKREIVNIEPWDHVRRDMIILLLRSIIERNIQGDLAELGVWKGYTAKLIHHYVPERHFYLFDTFSGFDKRDIVAENKHTGHKIDKRDFSDTTKQNVLRYIHPVNENVFCLAGYFPESIPSHLFNKSYSFVHLDADLYYPIMAGLDFFYERVTFGGFILIHDYNAWPGVRKAVDEFCAKTHQILIPFPDKSGSALIVKS